MPTKTRNPFLPDSVRQPQKLSPLAARLSRHLHWASAVAAGFQQTDGSRHWHPGSFVFGLQSQRWMLLQRRIHKFQLLQSHTHQHTSITNHFLTQQSTLVREQILPAPSAVSSQATRQPAASVSPQQRFLARTMASHMTASLLMLQSSRPLISASRSSHKIKEVETPVEMTAQIQRRFKRAEERPPAISESFRTQGAPSLPATEQIVELSARSQRKNIASNDPQAPAALPALPALNFTQITDEVIRQIDRKLVSARERMGKI